MAERSGHKQVISEGDEFVCRACGKRWDATDERNGDVPTCTPITELRYEQHAVRSTIAFQNRYPERRLHHYRNRRMV